ncbi:hypothetical protein ACFLRB_04310 [Acidobacteriota bacterium]
MVEFSGENIRSLGPKSHVKCDRCGEYIVPGLLNNTTKDSASILSRLGKNYEGKEYILSGVTRNAFKNGIIIEFNPENIADLIDGAPNPSTPLEVLDQVLLYISNKSQPFDFTFPLNLEFDYPLFYAKNGSELKYVLSNPEYKGYLDFGSSNNGNTLKLRPVGWERADAIRRKRPDLKQAFVAMWFNEDMIDVYTKAIYPALDTTGYKPYRVDLDKSNTNMIDNKIIAEIRKSRILVVDLTGARPSVTFEAGFAMGLGIELIWTCREDDKNKIPFDIRQFPFIIWKTHEELKKELINKIEALGQNIERVR